MTVPDHKRAAVFNPRAAAVGIHIGHCQRAGAGLGQAAGAAHLIGDQNAVAAVEDQYRVVADSTAAQCANGAAIAHLQGARADDR